MRDVLFGAGNVIALILSIGLVGVWIAYGLLFHWSKRKAGRAFYYFLTSLTGIIVLNVVTLWGGKLWFAEVFGEGTYVREIVRIVIYLAVLYALGWIVYSLVYNWRRAGTVLDLEKRAAKARAALDGEPIPHTEEIDIP